MERHGVLVVTCPDRPGIVAAIAGFLAERGANIVEAQQHSERSSGRFFFRVQFEPRGVPDETLRREFAPIAARFSMEWRLGFTDQPKRMAIFVSKYDHCLLDLLWRQRAGEIRAEVPIVISNHPDLRSVVEGFGIRFEHVPITPETKAEQERRELELLAQCEVEFVVLARYMQVLSPVFLAGFPLRVINVHHGLLPSFPGARPYSQARERGVKVIGATAHYATEELDDGPIIDQDVVAVTHRDTVADLVRKGRDVERIVLARAVRAHAEDRVFVDGRRTVVFA
ncbi:MAG: formyltetrahydrofolate deformylase [Chloroflexota bacterium]|nr:formyltetrahydrofolate deformylase [Dehalococcoidia bacterium]MDW8252568.1 formyltetrahydrofolate deformylase [Chloroflexota bacterium]